MAVFKCKMCGGDLQTDEKVSVGVCGYCGTQQTLPRLDDDKRANLYDRANHFRRNGEFDKAAGIYETILNEDRTDAEAYWSLVLCKYGIEYVEDPKTKKRVPTCNRTQFTSVFADEDYKQAIANADAGARVVYEAEAKAIDAIQKGILAISAQEEPFEVFVCYKETDNNGRRTPDSVLANDLYHQLTQEGLKVFFARITLEDKLGTAYEPYIFAALNSAKVMVVIGTKADHFNAPWVKNEWSRYLALIKSDPNKTLIPAYKDMDPYDLPEEFSHLQAQDMSRLGFMQDLIRGIKKILGAAQPADKRETVVVNGTSSAEPLLKRAYLCLEDGDFMKADELLEQVLNIDPENARAYIGKLMAGLRVKREETLENLNEPIANYGDYQKALRFGDEGTKTRLRAYNQSIVERLEEQRKEQQARLEEQRKQDAFQKIVDKRKEIFSLGASYRAAEYARLAGEFKALSGYRDADAQAEECERLAEEARVADEREKEEKRLQDERARAKAAMRRESIIKKVKILTPVALVCIAFLILLNPVIIPSVKYGNAEKLFDAGEYVAAIAAFEDLGDFKDSKGYVKKVAGRIYEQSGAEVGSVYINKRITFGNYEQDNDLSNGKEPIRWIVLAKDEEKALIISEVCLDAKPYNKKSVYVTWETCTLREWLNNEFLNTAFSEAERAVISTVTVDNPDNSKFNTRGGNPTSDKVFLLSIDEAERYFNSATARQAGSTPFAVSNGVDFSDDNGNSHWWLRSPGRNPLFAGIVDYDGYVYSPGVSDPDIGVRPALWINLES